MTPRLLPRPKVMYDARDPSSVSRGLALAAAVESDHDLHWQKLDLTTAHVENSILMALAALKDGKTGVIASIPLRPLQPALELDKNNWYVPSPVSLAGQPLRHYYVRAALLREDGSTEGLYLQANLGKKFGVHGDFKIKLEHFQPPHVVEALIFKI